MYHTLDPRVNIGAWQCGSVYMNVPYKKPTPYSGSECTAVFDAVKALRADDRAASVLLDDAHLVGHPLPGVYTWRGAGYRVDLRRWDARGASHLWAAVYAV
jgi:hypothetical protein